VWKSSIHQRGKSCGLTKSNADASGQEKSGAKGIKEDKPVRRNNYKSGQSTHARIGGTKGSRLAMEGTCVKDVLKGEKKSRNRRNLARSPAK